MRRRIEVRGGTRRLLAALGLLAVLGVPAVLAAPGAAAASASGHLRSPADDHSCRRAGGTPVVLMSMIGPVHECQGGHS